MKVRLTQIDGKLPNLALMKLAAFHGEQGHEVTLKTTVQRELFEPDYDLVYGSSIFTRSAPLIARLRTEFPGAIIGGTGLGDDWTTVEQHLGVESYERHDYGIYPGFDNSIGFTMRGCRLSCGFCVVPRKEGRPISVGTLASIWRGDPWPKNIVLLDNDFFGQPKPAWSAILEEAKAGGFRISFNQGINIRLVRDDETAQAIAAAPYYDDSFRVRRLYTAFDNAGDEQIFRAGVERLLAAGVGGDRIMVYMLVGYDPRETAESVFHRFNVMLEYGLRPYPMVYQQVGSSKAGNGLDYRWLKDFQRWVIRRHYHTRTFAEYQAEPESRRLLHHRETREAFVSEML